MATTVLIVDDHAGFRASARRLLRAEGFEVVGEAEDGRSGLLAARSLHPELVLLDVGLPDRDGFDVARELGEEPDAPAIVLVTGRDTDALEQRVADSPARGLLPKDRLSGASLGALI